MAPRESTEPFPALSPVTSESQVLPSSPETSPSHGTPMRAPSSSVGRTRQSRGQSLVQTFVNSSPPLGMWQATGEASAKIPTLPEIRDGSFGEQGWSPEGQMERRGANPHEIHRRTSRARRSSASVKTKDASTPQSAAAEFGPHQPILQEEVTNEETKKDAKLDSKPNDTRNMSLPSIDKSEKAINIMDIIPSADGPDETGTYPNGYRFPKKHTRSQSITIGLKAFWKFFLTPLGFLITIYCLNIVGWGAMIFFVLIYAAPAMCHPSCNDPYSARNVWIEIDAQVLTALFCVTGFGLIPWRFRDFYYLMKWRLGKDLKYHRKLAGIYRSWYRLPGSNELAESIAPPPVYNKKRIETDADPPPYTPEELKKLEDNPALPLPPTSIPDPPLTGFRALPTKSWNLDLVIWMYMLNTWIQGALCGIMWGMNRFQRPAAATGLLISVGSVTGIVAGVVVFIEGSEVKKIEGIPVKDYDVVESVEDYQKRKAKLDAKKSNKH